jgi:type VII secretion integral membrane protein EccD
MPTGYSRVTLVGTRQRVDVVLPSDEPIGRLMSDLLRLTDEPESHPARARMLVTADGAVLDAGATLTGTGVADGTILHLVGRSEVPPAPVVHDVTDETAADVDSRAGAWGPPAKRWTATGSLLVLLGVVAVLAPDVFGDASTGVVGVAALLIAAVGWVVGRRGSQPLGTALMLGAGVLATISAWTAGTAAAWSMPTRWLAVVTTAAVVALLGVAAPLGRGDLPGRLIGLGLAALWAVGMALDLPAHRIAAAAAAVVALLLGLLPRLALSASGLDVLDDRRAVDQAVSRPAVHSALAAAHRGLLVGAVTVAAGGALAGWLLATHPGPWTTPLAVVTTVVMLARARMYPLVGQRLPLLAGAGLVGVAVVVAWWSGTPGPPIGPMAVVLGVAAVPMLVLVVDPPEHMRAMLRRVVDWIEALAVVATVPLAAGVFGAYGRLLGMFH